MKATLPWLAAVLAVALIGSAAKAQFFGPCVRQAPDACGPGYYAPNIYGAYYGPNYYLRPVYPPFNGMVFGPCGPGGPGGPGGQGQPGSPGFPVHPYARSPRDFFMVD
jgi:hypothetical protein